MDLLLGKGIESKIKDITVYRGGAFIARTTKVMLEKNMSRSELKKFKNKQKKVENDHFLDAMMLAELLDD